MTSKEVFEIPVVLTSIASFLTPQDSLNIFYITNVSFQIFKELCQTNRNFYFATRVQQLIDNEWSKLHSSVYLWLSEQWLKRSAQYTFAKLWNKYFCHPIFAFFLILPLFDEVQVHISSQSLFHSVLFCTVYVWSIILCINILLAAIDINTKKKDSIFPSLDFISMPFCPCRSQIVDQLSNWSLPTLPYNLIKYTRNWFLSHQIQERDDLPSYYIPFALEHGPFLSLENMKVQISTIVRKKEQLEGLKQTDKCIAAIHRLRLLRDGIERPSDIWYGYNNFHYNVDDYSAKLPYLLLNILLDEEHDDPPSKAELISKMSDSTIRISCPIPNLQIPLWLQNVYLINYPQQQTKEYNSKTPWDFDYEMFTIERIQDIRNRIRRTMELSLRNLHPLFIYNPMYFIHAQYCYWKYQGAYFSEENWKTFLLFSLVWVCFLVSWRVYCVERNLCNILFEAIMICFLHIHFPILPKLVIPFSPYHFWKSLVSYTPQNDLSRKDEIKKLLQQWFSLQCLTVDTFHPISPIK